MRRVLGYGASCTILVLIVAGGMGRWLDEGQAAGLWVAGVVALTLQILGFAARTRWGTTPNRLLAAWAWSTGARFGAVLLMGWMVWRFEGLDAVTSLVGIAGFLFVMLLMEPAFTSPARIELDEGEIAHG